MAVGAKHNETRSWPATSQGHAYRGWIAICASLRTKEPKKDGGRTIYEMMMEKLVRTPDSVPRFAAVGLVKNEKDHFICYSEKLPLGAVVAVGWLQGCADTAGLQVTIEERAWGDYAPGRYAWQFTEMWRINEPLPVRGLQKLFDIDMPANWQDRATKVF